MKIAAYDIEDWELKILDKMQEKGHEVESTPDPLNADTAAQFQDAETVTTFIYSEFNKEILDKMPRLKLIATRSTGYNHIPLDLCKDRGITVSNVPSYGANTVAEHVFGLLLTISHNLEEAISRTRKGSFSPKGLQGFDLAGKTIGVIGTGDIGLHVVRIAKGFGMNVLAFDVKTKEDKAKELGFQYVDLDKLLADSDIITIHVPLMEKTRNFIDDEQFAKMKNGVVFLNTARGGLVRVQALAHALADKKVKAAGIDVLPEEPVIREEAELLRSVYEENQPLDVLLADNVLIRMRNVVVTPHSAFNTREAVTRILDTTIENILAFAEGQPKNVVS